MHIFNNQKGNIMKPLTIEIATPRLIIDELKLYVQILSMGIIRGKNHAKFTRAGLSSISTMMYCALGLNHPDGPEPYDELMREHLASSLSQLFIAMALDNDGIKDMIRYRERQDSHELIEFEQVKQNYFIISNKLKKFNDLIISNNLDEYI